MPNLTLVKLLPSACPCPAVFPGSHHQAVPLPAARWGRRNFFCIFFFLQRFFLCHLTTSASPPPLLEEKPLPPPPPPKHHRWAEAKPRPIRANFAPPRASHGKGAGPPLRARGREPRPPSAVPAQRRSRPPSRRSAPWRLRARKRAPRRAWRGGGPGPGFLAARGAMSEVVERTLSALPALLGPQHPAGPGPGRPSAGSRLGSLIRSITALGSKHVRAGACLPAPPRSSPRAPQGPRVPGAAAGGAPSPLGAPARGWVSAALRRGAGLCPRCWAARQVLVTSSCFVSRLQSRARFKVRLISFPRKKKSSSSRR